MSNQNSSPVVNMQTQVKIKLSDSTYWNNGQTVSVEQALNMGFTMFDLVAS